MTASIVVIAANKGGVGKTTLAYELAYLLNGVLVDLDWDPGGATYAWGYRPMLRTRVPLLDALADPTRVPRPVAARHRPRLVPSHPLLAEASVTTDLVSDRLVAWSHAWDAAFIVVDTHPGASSLTYGAMAAADLTVIPVVLGERELSALAGMLDELRDYRLLLIPNRVPARPDPVQIDRLAGLAQRHAVRVGPLISDHRWLSRRRRHTAVMSIRTPGQRVARMVTELSAVGQAVAEELAA